MIHRASIDVQTAARWRIASPGTGRLVNGQLSRTPNKSATRRLMASANDDAYSSLDSVHGVYLVSSQEEVRLTDLWASDEVCVLALGRSMG